MNNQQKYLVPFVLITSLFFLWGFIHNLDPILITHLKKTFQLSNFQSSLVDFSVYIAYFVMAIPAGIIMKKHGFKSGIILGLLLFAIGAFLFIPAASTHQYVVFLAALFVVASGLAILETAANPYATILGAPETAAQRLNLAQSFNGLAAVIAPIAGKYLILSKEETTTTQIEAMSIEAKNAFINTAANAVKVPFVILGVALLIITAIFYFTKLPDVKEDGLDSKRGLKEAWQHKHLRWSVVAQFFYVGAQVCVNSFFILFATKAAGLTEQNAASYLVAYGLAFMIGRFVGTFFMKFITPAKLLTYYTIINIGLCIIAIFGSGMITIYALIGIAFFMSIMFPTIFALGIKGIGADTKSGASLIIMSIIGGGILPLLLGYIADVSGNMQLGYIVPLICFAVIMYFGIKGHRSETTN
jgi:MFS transporter, FHS family, L-fucose permease